MSAACDYDVLVVGAGAAGLNAAALLAASGRRVAVVEARGRVGGRIFTRHVKAPTATDEDAAATPGMTIPVELGAEFIHGLPEETWRLVREAQLDTVELAGESLHFDGVRLEPERSGDGVWNALRDMTGWLTARSGADASFADYLQQSNLDPAARQAAIRYVEGFNAADHRVIGVAALARQQAAEDAIAAQRIFHVRAGYDSVPLFLQKKTEAAGGTVFLGRPVSLLRWRPGGVTATGVDCRGGEFTFRGRRAVLALPLGVLQSGDLRFDPEPADRLLIAGRMAMGTAIRIPMLFRSRFWSEAPMQARAPAVTRQLERLSFLLTDAGLPSTWWTCHPRETALITGWIGGPGTASLTGNAGSSPEPDGPIETALQTLATLFSMTPAQLRRRLIGCHFHDWSADPYARGAYSYMPAGASQASRLLAEPVAQTLYFAGEHATNTGHWGTVHGALDSGSAAADAIISAE